MGCSWKELSPKTPEKRGWGWSWKAPSAEQGKEEALDDSKGFWDLLFPWEHTWDSEVIACFSCPAQSVLPGVWCARASLAVRRPRSAAAGSRPCAPGIAGEWSGEGAGWCGQHAGEPRGRAGECRALPPPHLFHLEVAAQAGSAKAASLGVQLRTLV